MKIAFVRSLAVASAGVSCVFGAADHRAMAANLENHVVAFSEATDAMYGPGVPQGADNTFAIFSQPVINNAGNVAFLASYADLTPYSVLYGATYYTTSGEGLWLHTPGVGNQQMVQTYTAAPNRVGSIGMPILDNNNTVAFEGFTTTYANAVFRASLGTLQTVASTGTSGSTGPDLPDVTFNQIANGTGGMQYANGHMYFHGYLQGTGTNSTTAYTAARSDLGAASQTIVRSGLNSGPLAPDQSTYPNRSYYLNFVPMAVNDNGDMVMLGSLNGGSFGTSMWAKVDGATNNVDIFALAGTTGRTGPNIPGDPNSSFTFLQGAGYASMNNAGDVVYFGRRGSAVNTLMRMQGNTPEFLAKTGDSMNLPYGWTNQGFSAYSSPIIAGNGDIFVMASAGLNTSTQNRALWRYNDTDGFQVLAITGDVAFGPASILGGDIKFSDINSINANTNGDIVFYASLFGTGVGNDNFEAIFAIVAGELKLIARTGDLFDVDPTDGVDLRLIKKILPPETTANVGGQDGRRSYLNDLGQVAFGLVFDNGNSTYSSGIFVQSIPEPTSIALLSSATVLLIRRRRCTRLA